VIIAVLLIIICLFIVAFLHLLFKFDYETENLNLIIPRINTKRGLKKYAD